MGHAYVTHKSTAEGRARTISRRMARRMKYQVL